ncbi:MAG TPA: hypothetical protein VH089_03240, partial [Streptosporangiaceae bacterium]|nr:hypothetical protein [Streptosporangiaceae bacterium]
MAGLILADVWLGRPGPGLSGKHLVLAVGSLLAALTWVAWLPAERVGLRIRVLVSLAGMAAGCLAALVSPSTAAEALPLAIGVMAGSSIPVPEAAGVAACGLIT